MAEELKERDVSTIDYEQKSEFTRELPVTLNDHELQAYGKMLAEKVREEELAVDKKAQVAKEHNSRIQVIRNDIKRIADARAKGEELRPVRCAERLKGNVIEIVRLDREEVVDTRPADLTDLQTSIPGLTESAAERPMGTVLEFIPGGLSETPVGFDEGPTDLGPPAPSDTEHEQLLDEPADGTGVVRDDEGHLVGAAVESSTGDVVYIGAESLCVACGDAITEDQETAKDDGHTIHKKCAPDDTEWVSDPSDDPAASSLPEPTLSATIGEHVEAAPAAKKKRERSKAANEAKGTSSPKKKK